jgi:phenylalanyl-tRNA synthetase beta chain
MMETGLECIAYNCNRRNNDLLLFEFGKTYSASAIGKYSEERHLSIYITGKIRRDGWKGTGEQADFYFAKGIAEKILQGAGINDITYSPIADDKMNYSLRAKSSNEIIANIGSVHNNVLGRFDIRQPIFFIDMFWDKILLKNQKLAIRHNDVPKFPSAVRDLSIVVAKNLQYEEIERATAAARVNKLQSVNLFDIFESEKLGSDKKAMAISFTFLDEEKTLTDKDIDAMMGKIIGSYEKELKAEIRKIIKSLSYNRNKKGKSR